MAKVLCFDLDDTLLDKDGNPINIDEICRAIKKHQEAGGIILFVTDKKAYTRESLVQQVDPVKRLFDEMSKRGVDITIDGGTNYAIIANGETSSLVAGIGDFLRLSGEHRLNSGSVVDNDIVASPQDCCLGAITWKVVDGKELQLDVNGNAPIKVQLTVNNNIIEIDTDLKSLENISDGKFLHTLEGLVANGYYPTDMRLPEGMKFDIKNLHGCDRTVPMQSIVLMDDKVSNLEKFEQVGGETIFPDSKYLKDHLCKDIENQYDIVNRYGIDSKEDVTGMLNAIDIKITKQIRDRKILDEWQKIKKKYQDELERIADDKDLIKNIAKNLNTEVKSLIEEIRAQRLDNYTGKLQAKAAKSVSSFKVEVATKLANLPSGSEGRRKVIQFIKEDIEYYLENNQIDASNHQTLSEMAAILNNMATIQDNEIEKIDFDFIKENLNLNSSEENQFRQETGQFRQETGQIRQETGQKPNFLTLTDAQIQQLDAVAQRPTTPFKMDGLDKELRALDTSMDALISFVSKIDDAVLASKGNSVTLEGENGSVNVRVFNNQNFDYAVTDFYASALPYLKALAFVNEHESSIELDSEYLKACLTTFSQQIQAIDKEAKHGATPEHFSQAEKASKAFIAALCDHLAEKRRVKAGVNDEDWVKVKAKYHEQAYKDLILARDIQSMLEPTEDAVCTFTRTEGEPPVVQLSQRITFQPPPAREYGQRSTAWITQGIEKHGEWFQNLTNDRDMRHAMLQASPPSTSRALPNCANAFDETVYTLKGSAGAYEVSGKTHDIRIGISSPYSIKSFDDRVQMAFESMKTMFDDERLEQMVHAYLQKWDELIQDGETVTIPILHQTLVAPTLAPSTIPDLDFIAVKNAANEKFKEYLAGKVIEIEPMMGQAAEEGGKKVIFNFELRQTNNCINIWQSSTIPRNNDVKDSKQLVQDSTKNLARLDSDNVQFKDSNDRQAVQKALEYLQSPRNSIIPFDLFNMSRRNPSKSQQQAIDSIAKKLYDGTLASNIPPEKQREMGKLLQATVNLKKVNHESLLGRLNRRIKNLGRLPNWAGPFKGMPNPIIAPISWALNLPSYVAKYAYNTGERFVNYIRHGTPSRIRDVLLPTIGGYKNNQTMKSAYEIIIADQLGVSIGGCKSAADRKGDVSCNVAALSQQYEREGVVADVTGPDKAFGDYLHNHVQKLEDAGHQNRVCAHHDKLGGRKMWETRSYQHAHARSDAKAKEKSASKFRKIGSPFKKPGILSRLFGGSNAYDAANQKTLSAYKPDDEVSVNLAQPQSQLDTEKQKELEAQAKHVIDRAKPRFEEKLGVLTQCNARDSNVPVLLGNMKDTLIRLKEIGENEALPLQMRQDALNKIKELAPVSIPIHYLNAEISGSNPVTRGLMREVMQNVLTTVKAGEPFERDLPIPNSPFMAKIQLNSQQSSVIRTILDEVIAKAEPDRQGYLYQNIMDYLYLGRTDAKSIENLGRRLANEVRVPVPESLKNSSTVNQFHATASATRDLKPPESSPPIDVANKQNQDQTFTEDPDHPRTPLPTTRGGGGGRG